MKGIIKKAFMDKYTRQYHEVGKVVEFTDARIKELSAMGFVEVKADVKPVKVSKAVEETAEEATKEEPKKAKKTTKKK